MKLLINPAMDIKGGLIRPLYHSWTVTGIYANSFPSVMISQPSNKM